jgi:glyceraldehyde-3-phosphate dehydrogenase type I
MTQRLAINGFGRIGRTAFRVWAERPDALAALDLVAINERADRDTAIHLARFDSTHGRFAGSIEPTADGMCVNTTALSSKNVAIYNHDTINTLPWHRLAVDIVLECTGAFSDRATAELHVQAGARHVLFSQPAEPDVDLTVVWGVNDDQLRAGHQIVSAGSCTTNALIPALKVLDDCFGIEAGTVTTVHSAMNDQPVLDAYHNTDLRKTRAAFQSIIPVDTGLAIGVPRILPQLEGKLTAHALRVPTLNVSAMDVTVYTQRDCTAKAVNDALAKAAQHGLAGVLGFTTAPLASCDFNGETCSSVVDASQTQVSANRLVKVLIWFDNEWAYANRLIDIALRIGALRDTTSHQ